MDKNKENIEHEIQEHEIYEQGLKDDPNATFSQCKNCKTEIRKKLRRCPYCGILNPTVTIKEIAITMTVVIVVMYAVSYFMK
ncbi:MAG: hypothetical protein U9Q04_06050 [Campylobacterota bacterium]|nr:hypothetical protein [Campylobacterota bacterium]